MKLILIFLCMLLAGCCNFGDDVCRPPPAIYTEAEAIAALVKQSVQIIQTGETYTIVIPSDHLFNQDSANFRDDAILILEPLAALLEDHETTLMTINGYTDDIGAPVRNRALTERQAQRVGEYLTEHGMDARIIYMRGFGSDRPVADNSISSHRWWNRRIEIKFREVVLPPLV